MRQGQGKLRGGAPVAAVGLAQDVPHPVRLVLLEQRIGVHVYAGAGDNTCKSKVVQLPEKGRQAAI